MKEIKNATLMTLPAKDKERKLVLTSVIYSQDNYYVFEIIAYAYDKLTEWVFCRDKEGKFRVREIKVEGNLYEYVETGDECCNYVGTALTYEEAEKKVREIAKQVAERREKVRQGRIMEEYRVFLI